MTTTTTLEFPPSQIVSLKGESQHISLNFCTQLFRFLFRCENETSRLEFIEAIRRVLPSRALAETADSQSVEEDFGTSVTTGLEDTIDLLTRGFYRWYLDALSPQPSSAPLVSETSESLEQLPLPLVLSASSSQIASSPPPAPAPISSTPLLYPPLKIVKEAVFLYRSIGSASWVPRYCVLTNEAFYISSYTSSPTNPESIPPSTGAHLRRTSVTLQPPVIVVPLTVAKVDKNLPNYSSEPNGPEVAFAVWCPLSYGLLGCDARTKEEWIRIIAEAMEVRVFRRYLLNHFLRRQSRRKVKVKPGLVDCRMKKIIVKNIFI